MIYFKLGIAYLITFVYIIVTVIVGILYILVFGIPIILSAIYSNPWFMILYTLYPLIYYRIFVVWGYAMMSLQSMLDYGLNRIE